MSRGNYRHWISSVVFEPIMPGSTLKKCISCMQQIRVACKICKICGAQQPLKQNIKKAQEKVNSQWGEKLKTGGNLCKLVDSAQILIHKFKMAGLNPIFIYGCEKKNSFSCGFLDGIEVKTEKEKDTVKLLKSLYENLVKVSGKRKRASEASSRLDAEGPIRLHPAGKEGPRDPASLEAEVREQNGRSPVLSAPRGEDSETVTPMMASEPPPPPGVCAPPPPLYSVKVYCPPEHTGSGSATPTTASEPSPASGTSATTRDMALPSSCLPCLFPPTSTSSPALPTPQLEHKGGIKQGRKVNPEDWDFHDNKESFPYTKVVTKDSKW